MVESVWSPVAALAFLWEYKELGVLPFQAASIPMASDMPPASGVIVVVCAVVLAMAFLFVPYYFTGRKRWLSIPIIWWPWGLVVSGILGEISGSHSGWLIGAFLLDRSLALARPQQYGIGVNFGRTTGNGSAWLLR